MKTWQKVSLVTLVVLIIFSIRVFFIWRERHEAMMTPPTPAEPQLTQDEMVLPRKMYIQDASDAKALEGKTVWIQAGYSLDYYPYTGHRVEFAHKSGVLPSVQPMKIENIVTQKAPAGLTTRVPHGDRQVFAVFKMPDKPEEFATAIGFLQGSDATMYCDQIFYYDAPQTMYKYWGAKVWAAIDAHHPILGMNELQTAMAVGVVQRSETSDIGNRTVYYDAGPQRWAVTFRHDKATMVKQQ
ncbi:MAG TPA: hypothetical protein VMU92_00280 [Acidobacteriaceae bacterium]|nr:hypothetical protein [Acidobacteriaceae bacterium]